MRCLLLLSIAVCMMSANVQAQSTRARKVSVVQARRLVLAGLPMSQRSLPGLGADQYDDPNAMRFLFFIVTWAAHEGQSVVVGNYAVDPYTGDVWSATESCDEVQTRKLEKLQRHLRKGLGLTEVEYEKLKTKGPLCAE